MSRRNINPDQLRMFMTPREIVSTIPQNETRVKGPEDIAKDEWGAQRKIANAKGQPTFYESLVTEGVKKPIDIIHDEDFGPVVANGHHRLSVSLQVAPDRYIPVLHHKSGASVDWRGAGNDPRGEHPYDPR